MIKTATANEGEKNMSEITATQAMKEIAKAKAIADDGSLMSACASGFLRAITCGRAVTERMIQMGSAAYAPTAGLYLKIFEMIDAGELTVHGDLDIS